MRWHAILVCVAITGCGGRVRDEPAALEDAAIDDVAIEDGSGGFKLDTESPIGSGGAPKWPDAFPDVSVDWGPTDGPTAVAPPLTSLPTIVRPPDCPATLPLDGSVCATSSVCQYAGCAPATPDRANCIDGKWHLATHACTDIAGRCPTGMPVDGTPCKPMPGVYCPYGRGCAKVALAHCSGKWETTFGDIDCRAAEGCPATSAPLDTLCHDSFTCRSFDACGEMVTQRCTAGRFEAPPPTCTTTDRSECPPSLPEGRGACPRDGIVCAYANACGTYDIARCRLDDGWEISLPPCAAPDCPVLPLTGEPCGTSGTTCRYPVGKGCERDCTCTATGWSCGGTSCPRDP